MGKPDIQNPLRTTNGFKHPWNLNGAFGPFAAKVGPGKKRFDRLNRVTRVLRAAAAATKLGKPTHA